MNIVSFLVGLWIGGPLGILMICIFKRGSRADKVDRRKDIPGKWVYPERRRR